MKLIASEHFERYTDELDKARRNEDEAYKQLQIIYSHVTTLNAINPKPLRRAGQTGKLVHDLLNALRDYAYAKQKRQAVENI